jgi:protein-S-isoprenylcysteine O-methyltransferase Ste14
MLSFGDNMRFFDLRLPLGLLFIILGLLLVLAGLLAAPTAETRSLGLNINLVWGMVMIGFGVLCLLLARRETRRRRRARPPE